MNNQKRFTIGEFAEVCHTTKDTLFHYQDMKLIKPTRNPSNRYREYTSDQVLTFQMISLLKQSGCNLTEIEDYLYHKEISMFPEILEESEKRLEEKRREMEKAVRQMRRIRSNYDYAYNEANIPPHFENMPSPRFIVKTPIQPVDLAASDELDIAELCRHLDACDALPAADKIPIGMLLPTLSRIAPEESAELFSFVSERVEGQNFEMLPPGEYLSCLHRGSKATIVDTLLKLARFAERSKRRCVGRTFLLNLADVFTVFFKEQYVTQVFTRVEPLN